MGNNAVAFVHIPPETVRQTLDQAAAPEGEQARASGSVLLTGADGNAYRVRFFDDAVSVELGVGIGYAEPDVMGVLVATALGDLMDLHADPRGVPLIPASYEPKARTWDGLVEELGDAADWVPVEGPQVLDPMQDMLGAFGPQAGDLMGLAARMQGQDPAMLMQQAMQMAQQLAASGQLEQMQRAMMQMMATRSGVVDAQVEGDAAGEPGAAAAPALDLQALASQAERMLDANPELKRTLLAQLGAMPAPDPEDDKDKR